MAGKTIALMVLGALAAAGLGWGCYDQGESPGDFLVISCSPATGQTNVPQNATILIRFTNHPDHTTIQGTKQIILVDQANSIIPASFTFQGEVLTMTPLTPLGQSATYGIAVRPGVRDIYGNNIQVPFEARFSTGSSVVAIPNWPPFSVQTAVTPVPPGVTGTFTATGAMILARARHRMTVLVDGRVLCTGGEHDAPLGRVLQQAELFDPLTYQWNFSMSLGNGINGMHYKRYGHTSTLLKDGRVLLTGGSDNHKILNVAELYDPKTDQFIVVQARMASCRVFHTAELLDNGNVVLIGGWENNLVSNASTAQGGGVSYILDSMEIYDIYAGTFTHTAQSMMPRVSYNANRIQYGQSPGVSTSAGRFYHTSSKLPDNTVMYCGGYGDPWLPQAFTMDDAQLFLPDSGGSGVNGLVRHCGTNLTVPRACHTATVLQTGDQAVEGVVIIAGGFTNSPYQGALQSTEMFDYKEIATTGIWANDKGCFAPIAMAMTSTRHNHTGNLVMNGAFKGGVLFTGGAQHLPVQNPQWPPPDPRLYPWLEPTGCGACRLTFSTDIWMPYGFGKYTTKPFRGLNITSSLGVTTDPQGNPTDLGSFYGAGVYLHQAVSFTNGVVLITGGSWCPFCMQGPNAWSTYFSANVGGWRAAAPSVIFNP